MTQAQRINRIQYHLDTLIALQQNNVPVNNRAIARQIANL